MRRIAGRCVRQKKYAMSIKLVETQKGHEISMTIAFLQYRNVCIRMESVLAYLPLSDIIDTWSYTTRF